MTETDPTVYPGIAKVRHLLYADKAAAQLPPWWAVVRIAENGETPDLTPPPIRESGVVSAAVIHSGDSLPGVLRRAVAAVIAIDAHRAETARKAEAPHPLDGLGVGSIVGRRKGFALRKDREGWWLILRTECGFWTEKNVRSEWCDGWAILHREPATPEPEPGPDPRRPDLRVGLVVEDEPPQGWEVAVDPGAGNLMHGAKGWSSERLGVGGVPWIDMRCTYERLTLVAFHPEHAGLDPEPSPVRDVRVGDRVRDRLGRALTVKGVIPTGYHASSREGAGAKWYAHGALTHLYAPGDVIESADAPEPGPTTVLRSNRFGTVTRGADGWHVTGLHDAPWRLLSGFPLTVESI